MSRLTERLSGATLVFLGALFWSFNAPLIQFLTLPSILACGLRSLIAGIVLLFVARPKKWLWNRWILTYCLSYAALCFSVVLSLSLTSAPIAIGMQYTAAIWIFLFDVLIHRKFSWRRFLPVLLILIGVLLFMQSGLDDGSVLGNTIALTEGVFFTTMTLSATKIHDVSSLELTTTANLFTGLLLSVLFPSTMMKVTTLSGLEWGIMLFLGIVQIGLGYCFYNAGLKKTSPQKASILAIFEMILGPIWVMIFLHDIPQPKVLTGFAIILLGILLNAFLSQNKENRPNIPPRKTLLPHDFKHPKGTTYTPSLRR